MSLAFGTGVWDPVEEVVEDVVTAEAAQALHALLDSPGEPPAYNDPIPPLWHWLAFLPRVAQRELGPDGHPLRGGFLPPVALPRRMFVGGEISLPASPLRIGMPLVRTGRVVAVEEKLGGSGPLSFVTVDYCISREPEDNNRMVLGSAVSETQRIVYRSAPVGPNARDSFRHPAGRGVDDPRWSAGFDLGIDPTVLFRFSALTYNAHRIHYDRDWATRVEGYPGLVVHGPLQAIALAEVCRRHSPLRIEGFEFRAVRPAFDDGPLRLRAREADLRFELAAYNGDGDVTMIASATGCAKQTH